MIFFRYHDFFLIWFGALGAAVGSFLNVVIYRLPRGFLLGLPSRSMCVRCDRRLSWHENIPILGYLALRGRCRGCQAAISPRYPIVEALTAMLFVGVFRYFGLTFMTLYYCAFAAALLAITFIDIDFRIIPDTLSLWGIVLGFLGSFWVPSLGGWSSAAGALAGGGFFWGLGWLYEKVTGREGLGFGDVKLIAMIGAFLGPRGALGTIVISSMVGSIVGLTVMFVQKKDLKLAIPYGPFLAIGALTFLFWGDYLALRIYP